MIPLPVFTSPQSEVDADNPFDTLERQINDEFSDLLYVRSLFGSGQNSPVQDQEERRKRETETSEILIQLDDDDELTELTPKVEIDLNSVDNSEFCTLRTSGISPPVSPGLSEVPDIREIVGKRISTCISEALNNTFSTVSTPFSSKFNSLFDDGFLLSSRDSEQNGRRERSRSVEFSWSISDMDEDLRSIAMPTWSDEVSSSDEECNTYRLSRSLPIEVSRENVFINLRINFYKIATPKIRSDCLKYDASNIV